LYLTICNLAKCLFDGYLKERTLEKKDLHNLPENVFEKEMVTKAIRSSFLPGRTHPKLRLKTIGRIEI
jgi:hypothetical protein